MAKVHHRKARKDYPDHGIAKGDMYYTVSLKTGPRSSRTLRQLEPFRRSQLTSSEYLAALYGIEDRLAVVDNLEDAKEIAEELRTLGEEQADRRGAMPEGLQDAPAGELLNERAEACEQAASDIDEACDGVGDEPEDPGEFEDAPDADAFEAHSQAVADFEEQMETYNSERDEALELVQGVSVG